MDTNELNVLFSKIANQIKLCNCNSEALKENINVENNKNKNILKTLCSVCNVDIIPQEKEIVSKMQIAFHETLEEIGINLNSFPTPQYLNDFNISEISQYQTKCDAKYLKKNAKGETLLHTAARKKDVQAVIEMLKNEVNPNTQDNAGWTPLHEAIFDDNYEITLQLLSAGAMVNVPGYDFTTPLHVATHHNNVQMVLVLLQFGADPTMRDISGRCPEYYTKDPEILSILKEYSGCPNMVQMAYKFQKKAVPRSIVIFVTDYSLLSVEERSSMENTLYIKFAANLEKDVTHVVVEHHENNVCELTYDILKATLMGCAIINKKWLHACIKENRLVNFSEYEVNGTTKFPTNNGPKKARNNFFNLNPPLFKGCHIFLKKMKDICMIKELIACSGAKLLNREPNPEHAPANYFLFHCDPGHAMECASSIILYEDGPHAPKLKYNMKHLKSLSLDWFFDCIQTFSVRDPY